MQKQKIISILIILIVVAFVISQITLAVWWNPFSWNIWNYFFYKPNQQVGAKDPVEVNCLQKGGNFGVRINYQGEPACYCDFPNGEQTNMENWYFYKGKCISNQTNINDLKDFLQVPQTEEACQQKGGTWRPPLPQNYPLCIMKFYDGGKSCSSHSECQGGCIITKISEIGEGIGKCREDNNNWGCYAEFNSSNIECIAGDIHSVCDKNSKNDVGCRDANNDSKK